MIDSADMEALAAWNLGLEDLQGGFERMAGAPAFPRAARTLIGSMLAAAEADRALDSVFKDAGRYVVTLFAMWLHVSDGLTLPRLKAVCHASGFLSASRARSLLQFLTHLQCVTVVTPARGGAAAVYAPAPWFEAAWSGHLKAGLRAAAYVEPAAERALAAMEADPALANAFLAHHAAGLLQLAGQQDVHVRDGYMEVFFDRHAGIQTVWTLLLSGEEAGFPAAGGQPLSIAAMSRRLGVSRIHLSRMFDDAEREGLLSRTEDRAVVLSEGLRMRMRFDYSMQLQQLLSAAAKALQQQAWAPAPMANA